MNEILKQIARELREHTGDDEHEGRKLWHVLTALRGPDSGSIRVKFATTAIIRAKIGVPEDNSGGAIVAQEDTSENVETRRRLKFAELAESTHFVRHAQKAFEALDLEWDEVNEL